MLTSESVLLFLSDVSYGAQTPELLAVAAELAAGQRLLRALKRPLVAGQSTDELLLDLQRIAYGQSDAEDPASL